MNKLSSWIETLEKFIAMILIATMTIIIAVAVVFRYFLDAPIFWASEASIFIMAWITFLGGSLGLKYKSQASVTFLVDRFSVKGKRYFEIVSHIIILMFIGILLYLSYPWLLSVINLTSSTMRLPMWIPYASVPVGLSFAFIHLLTHLVNLLKTKEQGGQTL
ncbi:TRAP transporter permease DctQ [Sporosarcina sp. P16b]|uniref:TRAP transporter small permease n=1 Tax=Sporosarcina sp. P16b TaxID=2048261 RepID=UPI000C16737B|nr:TRAP transporter small permease [Sporosarcina sp. P16b]PIC70290.1 TRAP transporter permease DctQ [Sporosarcina sp. P16b]